MDTMETNGPSWPSGDTVTSFVPTVSVTLDPQSASGYLQLSEDWKCVTYSGLYHSVYLHPQQFDCEPGVLGNKGFTWGKVYWEVEVEREDWFEDEEEELLQVTMLREGFTEEGRSNKLGSKDGIKTRQRA